MIKYGRIVIQSIDFDVESLIMTHLYHRVPARRLATALALIAYFSFWEARSTWADTIYSNFGQGDTFNSLASEIIAGTNSPFGSQQDIAASFVAGNNYNLTNVRLPLILTAGSNSVQLGITPDDNGQPDATPLLLETVSVDPNLSFTTWTPSTNLTLTMNQTYWLTVMAGMPDTQAEWLLSIVNTQGVSRQSSGAGWLNDLNSITPTFRVEGTPVVVPETNTVTLLFLGGLFLVGSTTLARRPKATVRVVVLAKPTRKPSRRF